MNEVAETLMRSTEILWELRGVISKPLIGGAFGSGRFVIASTSYISNGLHDSLYFIQAVETGALIAFGKSKEAAMTMGRNVLSKWSDREFAEYMARVRARYDEIRAEEARAIREAEEEIAAMRKQRQKSVPSIPRRRREIFDKSDGKCHYCGVALTLDGRWHIEHKMPRALGGGNEPTNLVASCVPCNHKKRDRTDVEFIAERAKEAA